MNNGPVNAAAGRTALILSFDTPSPVDYGGIYDVISRAQALADHGYVVDYVGVTVDKERLRKWQNERESSNKLFRRVYVLCGKTAIRYVAALTPVSALRRNVRLPADMRSYLAAQRYGVVLIDHIKMVPFAQRIVPHLQGDVRLRMHNDEAQYYASLARRERGRLRASILWLESIKYRRYQKRIITSRMVDRVYYISREDQVRLSSGNARPGVVLPVFTGIERVEESGIPFGQRIIDFLYVGNLELEENLEGVKSALEFLQANEVPVKTALVCGRCKGIARQNAVLKELGPFPFCDARFNVPQAELRSLYLQAKFFLNFSVGTGGVKTKLIDALAQGIVVITNELGARGSGLEGACVIASKATISVISAALTGEAEYERLRAVSIEALREYAKQTRLVYESEFGAGG